MAMTIYNSGAVRTAASQIRQGISAMDASVIADLRAVRSALPDNFQGEASNALSQKLSEIDMDIVNLRQALDQISRRLDRFADEIDEADRRNSQMF